MRIWGYVLLVLGIVFLILFAFAEFGGAHLGVVPFFVSFLLLTIGWNLRNSGKGIVQAKPADQTGGSAPAETAQTASGTPEFSTVELPLTPEIAAVIAGKNARTRKTLLFLSGGCVIFFAALGAVLSLTDKTPGGGVTFLAIFGLLGILCALMIYGISWLTTMKPVRRDLRGTTYLRTTGPIEVVRISSGAMLRLADRAFLMNGRNGQAELSGMNWGKVDYSPHGHIILGAWDRDGKNVYVLAGYNVQP